MKNLNSQQLEVITILHGGELTFDPLPSIDFGGYGFEATEEWEETDGSEQRSYSGFRFYGSPTKQAELINVWNDLTLEHSFKPLLTVEAAQKLIGKTIRCSYNDVNEGQEVFEIIDIVELPTNSIGQTTQKRLVTKSDGSSSMKRYIYKGREFSPTNREYIIDGKFVEFEYPRKLSDLVIEDKIADVHGRYIKSINYGKIPNPGIFKGKLNSVYIGDPETDGYTVTFKDGTVEYMDYKNISQLFPNVINCYDTQGGEIEGYEVKEGDTWCYEWQGIFRRGSGAERLFIEEIITT